jgi:phage-related protein (TIGR01555 family)
MIYDSNGRPMEAAPAPVRDRLDGYEPTREVLPEYQRDLEALVDAMQNGRMDSALLNGAHLDAFVNELTGLGTTWGDKTLGGLPGGPAVRVFARCFAEAEARYRGTDIGRGMVERYPDEMTRRGWDLEVQPSKDDMEVAADPLARADAARAEPRRAAAGWRKIARSGRLDGKQRTVARERARRWDLVANGEMPAAAAPPPPPGPLPRINDSGMELTEAMDSWADSIRMTRSVNQAMRYERAFGGGAVFIGVDDGGRPLTEPLDIDRVKSVTHLTPLRGGFDGEVVMWRPYNDPRKPKYGEPEIYQVRNTSVQLSRPPAPGEGAVSQVVPIGPGGSTIFWVHESRFLIFDGEPTSREAQQEMRGWGDSIFTRANDPLSQYEQIWQAVAVLMQEFSIATLSIKGFAKALAEKKAAARETFIQVARLQAIIQSVARMRYIDSEETFNRTTASVAGVEGILSAAATRVAAAAETPVSILFGKLAGGLGASEDPSIRSFYDRIEGEQHNRLLPQLTRLYRIGWRAKNSPTQGKEPERWGVYFRPLWQLTELEQADVRSKTSAADVAEVNANIVTPAEVAAKRYGGTEYDTGAIVLDMEERTGESERQASAATRAAQAALADPIDAPGAPSQAPAPASGAASIPVLPQIAMPSDPITSDPTSTPSVVTETGAGGRPGPIAGDHEELLDEDDPADPSTYRRDEAEHVPAGSPDGGQFAPGGGGAGGAGGSGGGGGEASSSSVKTASLGQLSTRLARLGRQNAGLARPDQHPEYQAVVKELKRRGIKSFGALEKAIASGK